MEINGKRLLEDLYALRHFGASGEGVIRRSFSAIDIESRHWLVKKIQDAGLQAEIDGMGNVIGRVAEVEQALLMGSHTDTQPQGGWLDGAMGVIYALEISRSAREQYGKKYPVDIASWMDEEGCFLTCLGSRSFCGKLTEDELSQACNPEGLLLADAIKTAGLDGVVATKLERERYLGFLEAHIEQGCVLENLGKRIGVVTSIVGGAAFQIALTGQQNHAGTTPMSMRRDAGMALIELAYAINAEFSEIAGKETVWTIGDVSFNPGAVNTIAGYSEFCLEFRDTEQRLIETMIERLYALTETFNRKSKVKVVIKPLGDPLPPAQMDPALQKHIAAAAERHAPGQWMSMPSGAGHDAAVFADLMPTAMVFIPSIGGISHSFDENTADEDIVLGCQIMAEAAVSFLDSLAG